MSFMGGLRSVSEVSETICFNYICFVIFRISDFGNRFGVENRSGRAREGFKKLLGGRGFVLTEYEPVASHGNPVHDYFIDLGHLFCVQTVRFPDLYKTHMFIQRNSPPLGPSGKICSVMLLLLVC